VRHRAGSPTYLREQEGKTLTNGKGSPPSSDSTDLAAAQAAATQLGTRYSDLKLTGEQRQQLRADLVQAVATVDRIKQASQPAPDEQLLLTRSVTAGLTAAIEREA
jgi:DNA-binding transcriptional MocR family regulator